MIAQAETPVRAQARELQSPFRLHPNCGCVFAPWGMFGTLYTVETEAEFRRLSKKFPHVYWTSHVGTFNATFVLPLFFGKMFHWSLLEDCTASVAVLVCLYLPYAMRVRAETKYLSIAQRRPSLLASLRHYAFERDRGRLWYLSILYSLCSWILWAASSGVHGNQRLLLCLLLAVSIVSALWHSLLIIVRESAMTKEGAGK